MVEIHLEKDWYLFHRGVNWIVARKKPIMIKDKPSYKLYKSSSFQNEEDALKFYFKHVRIDENDIHSWEELIATYKEGNNLIKRWMEELNG